MHFPVYTALPMTCHAHRQAANMLTEQKKLDTKKSPAITRVFSKFIVFSAAKSYRILRLLLFRFTSAEGAHHATMGGLRLGSYFRVLDPNPASRDQKPIHAMGLSFPNRIGLAAGLDKEANCVDALAAYGFGHIEVGTLTPIAQSGNPSPRLFRLVNHEAIINRMGFNNPGITKGIENLRDHIYTGILGINIGKNKATPNQRAVEDYLIGLRAAWPHADYIAVNLSSPNTPGLRDLQNIDESRKLIRRLKEEQDALAQSAGTTRPIAIKVAPDLTNQEVDALADSFLKLKVDAVIAGNTTIARDGVQDHPFATEAGGLSGAPLTERATHVVARFYKRLNNEIPIIGVGGILSARDAIEKIEAGAALVQIYTGLIYRGPDLVSRIIRATEWDR
ncbi:MAG: quinone-dependent dihydroorotate dehydrogenase [Verrucomicrobiota bacterium]